MVSGTVRRTAAVAGALTFAGGGAVIAYAQQNAEPPCTPHAGASGLSLCALDQDKGDKSITINRQAQAGTDKLFVVNSSKTALNVTAKVRPWTQSASGVTVPNRRGTLGGVALDAETFTLAPGTRKELAITLNRVPSSGYLYGALEVVGLPSDLDRRKGVVTGYRLVDSLRYTPSAPTTSIKTGAVKVAGSGKSRALTLSVRNTGNTLEPVSGTVKLKNALGTTNGSVKGTRILPGKSVRLALLSGNALKPGKYTATITLTQAKKKTTVTKKVTVRR
jgi:hypothetical protein